MLITPMFINHSISCSLLIVEGIRTQFDTAKYENKDYIYNIVMY